MRHDIGRGSNGDDPDIGKMSIFLGFSKFTHFFCIFNVFDFYVFFFVLIFLYFFTGNQTKGVYKKVEPKRIK